MMFRAHYNHKNKRKCVPCVPSCLPLLTNGTHAQPLPHKTFTTNVYHVYHFSRARTRGNFSQPYIFIKSKHTNHGKKFSRVRDVVIMVHMVNIYLKALLHKALLCVPFFKMVHKNCLMVHMAFQVIVFKNENMCTIAKERI